MFDMVGDTATGRGAGHGQTGLPRTPPRIGATGNDVTPAAAGDDHFEHLAEIDDFIFETRRAAGPQHPARRTGFITVNF